MEQFNLSNITKTDIVKYIINGYKKTEAIEARVKELELTQAKRDIILTRKYTAELLNISLPTLAKLDKQGKLVPTRDGKRVFYSPVVVMDFLNHREKKQSLKK